MDFLEGRTLRIMRSPAEARHQAEVFLFCFFGCGQHGTNTGSIHRKRLFSEHVLASVDGCLDVRGAKAGRSGQHDEVHAALDHLLVSVQAGKAMIWLDLYLVGDLLLEAREPMLEL